MTGDVLFVGSDNSWIVDSGATSHMCRAQSSFSVYEEFQGHGEVSVAMVDCLRLLVMELLV